MINLEEIKNELKEINNYYEGTFELDIEYDNKCKYNEKPLYYIVDSTENFYYDDGFSLFDYCFERVEKVVKKYFGENSYLDCMCPGRWIVGDYNDDEPYEYEDYVLCDDRPVF